MSQSGYVMDRWINDDDSFFKDVEINHGPVESARIIKQRDRLNDFILDLVAHGVDYALITTLNDDSVFEESFIESIHREAGTNAITCKDEHCVEGELSCIDMEDIIAYRIINLDIGC